MTKYLAAMAIVAGLAAGQADNTRQNRDNGSATAQQTTSSKADLETLRNIRRAITGDKSLSTYAHNVKITVRNGDVTLRGPVRSDGEKARVEVLAQQNGATSVSNELEVAPPK